MLMCVYVCVYVSPLATEIRNTLRKKVCMDNTRLSSVDDEFINDFYCLSFYPDCLLFLVYER